jgi:hypothetical protein
MGGEDRECARDFGVVRAERRLAELDRPTEPLRRSVDHRRLSGSGSRRRLGYRSRPDGSLAGQAERERERANASSKRNQGDLKGDRHAATI